MRPPKAYYRGRAIGCTLRDGGVRHDHAGMIAENRAAVRDSTHPSCISFTVFTMFTVPWTN